MEARLGSHSLYKVIFAVLLASMLIVGLNTRTPNSVRAAATYAFDFGTDSSPVAAGYTRVTEATAYSPGGFGWTDTTTLESRDRGAPADLTRDFVMDSSAARTFQTDLPNGIYAVTVTMGDNDNDHDNMVVSANGSTVLPNVTSLAGVFAVNTFSVTVSGGTLSLQFSDGGGADPTWVANGVLITAAAPPPVSDKFDFGTASSPVATGYTQVTEATAYSTGGFGWTDTTTLESRDRGAPADLTRDFVMDSSAARTFKTDLQNGMYAVTVTMGDHDYAHDNMVVSANGTTVLPNVTNAAGAFAVNNFAVNVTGGSLSLQFSDGGGADPTWVVNAVTINPAKILHINISSVGAQDGWILESAQNSGMGGSMNSTDTSLFVGDNTKNRQYRSILSFATASLPDRAVITNATLKLCSPGKAGSPWSLGSLLVDMKNGTFGAKALELTDFQALAGMSAGGTILDTPAGNYYYMSVPSAAFPLINKVGPTQFRLRFSTPNNNNLANDYMLFYSGDYNISLSRPMLMIDYYIP